MNYREALAYLDELNVFGSKLGLVRIKRLTQLLGMPQNKYKTIHVTGTNGKGSVSAMLREILSGAKLKTGLYISPHLVSYTERMSIDGVNISEADFAFCLEKVKAAVVRMLAEGEESPTQFEVLTALAFLYFAEKEVDYAVIEVGLGGLLDSTNVITPEVALITNVTFEHADKCGGTLEGIAEHKAGIIKPGRPVITAAEGKAWEIIQAAAKEKKADVYKMDRDFWAESVSFSPKGQLFRYGFRTEEKQEFSLRLLGTHQLANASLAVTAAKILSGKVPELTQAVTAEALERAAWPGRFEYLQKGGQEIIIDGAHNPAGMLALRSSLDAYFPDRPRVFLLGILADKAIDEMLEILLRPDDVVVFTPPDSERAAEAGYLASRIKNDSVYAEPDNAKALRLACGLAGNSSLLCCAGSLYLIGGIRHMLLEGAACGEE